MMNIRDAIKKEGLVLPSPPQPVGNYCASLISGNLLYISGQLPFDQGQMLHI
ncbi:hypothetical protein [Oleiphilus sp. HI0125]|uniref:hypothetical protein n=1 Tax=Oleiphilus sp. HI0125 TaxID=1822266 RepID=UPI0012E760B5|nr:hypothetical protein [Oleiphilus sp. HI0125]